MNFKQLMAGIEAAVPAVAQVVTAMHPEDGLEGAKIAAGVQLFQFVCAGLHQIAAASAAAAPAAPTTSQPAVIAAPPVTAPAAPVLPAAVAAPEVAIPNAA